MIDIYFWTTPNGYKPLLFLEETGLPYKIVPINIGKGEQFAPEFIKISPNNRIPALIDHEPADGGEPISIFESGAMLMYMAEKAGRFLPTDVRGRFDVLQWLFWQVAGLGPMAGQNHHFNIYAPEKIPYAIDRYMKETGRLYAALNRQLADRYFVAGDYSIADMASYPWVFRHERQKIDLNDFPHVKRWFEAIAARPATVRAYEKGGAVNQNQSMSDAAKKVLFGQGPEVVKA
jgi:GST-like protein